MSAIEAYAASVTVEPEWEVGDATATEIDRELAPVFERLHVAGDRAEIDVP